MMYSVSGRDKPDKIHSLANKRGRPWKQANPASHSTLTNFLKHWKLETRPRFLSFTAPSGPPSATQSRSVRDYKAEQETGW